MKIVTTFIKAKTLCCLVTFLVTVFFTPAYATGVSQPNETFLPVTNHLLAQFNASQVDVTKATPGLEYANNIGQALGTVRLVKAPFDVKDLVIPATYQNKPVTAIMGTLFIRGSDESRRRYNSTNAGNTNLRSVYIPRSVGAIDPEHNPFFYCPNLESIIVDPSNPYLRSEANCIIQGFPLNGQVLEGIMVGCKTSKIPEGIAFIAGNAFSGSGLTSITIPNSVQEIGEFAFWECSNLEGVFIPSSVVKMGTNTFADCEVVTIFTGHSSKPADWASDWNPLNRPVVWGASGLPNSLNTSSRNISSSTKEYKIGDIGPAGGLVFYDKGNNTNGWRYLETAPVGTEKKLAWSTGRKQFPVTKTAIGTGIANTVLVVGTLIRNSESNKAAQYCDALNINGCSDWFLPSKDELNLIYKNLKQKGLGGFKNDGSYWTSSVSTNDEWGVETTETWYQYFGDGTQMGTKGFDAYDETFELYVRAVRTF